MQGRGQQVELVELCLGMLHLYQLQGVDAPAHVSLRPNCGP